MSAISQVQKKIQKGGIRPGQTMTVGRRLWLRLQWEILDRSPMVGDVAWLRAKRPGFDQSRAGGVVAVDGVKVFWSAP